MPHTVSTTLAGTSCKFPRAILRAAGLAALGLFALHVIDSAIFLVYAFGTLDLLPDLIGLGI